MCNYLKNMEGYKLNDLKYKEFDSIQEMFDRAFKRVNTFEDFRTKPVEGKEKRAGTELVQEITKKQKVEDDKEITELKQLMKIIPDEEEVAIDAIPLAVKYPRIVDWKIHKEGKKSYYHIVRADGKSQMYMIFSQMLKSFDREDLEDLYKLVKTRYGSTRPVESMDYLLWNDMKTMFEPHSMQIYMLVEKKYPLTPPTLSMMLEKKLQIDYESEIAYQMCKLIKKQLKNLLDAVRITAAQVYVNTALMKLVLLMNFKENILSRQTAIPRGGRTGGRTGRGGRRTGEPTRRVCGRTDDVLSVSDLVEFCDADNRKKVDTSKALDASFSGTKSKEQDTSSKLGNDAHADDADIRPIYDEDPMVDL
ncbi:hypothetical protein Tco_0591761 [Tanacetum coccineum]